MLKRPEISKNICYGMRTRLFVAIAASMVFCLLAGCSSLTSGNDSSTTSSAKDNGTFAEIVASFDASVLNLDYTDRDKDPSYDESEATLIALDGSEILIDGDGATSEGTTLSITSEGTYIFSGTLNNGQIIVEVSNDNEEKVQLILNGVTIHNENGPAIYIVEAAKCFITLADGTVNTLTNGEEYELEDDSDEPYATLFSRADLTINGSGTLGVTSSYRHAVCSKDDLVIMGGTFIVNAVEDGLRGRDRVKILDGDFTIIAGGDGIKSNKDNDAEKGFVSIDGGMFNIEAGDDGVQGVIYVRIAGGTFNVVAGDDTFHSDVEMLVAGGDVTVEAGDDAFHAETILTVDDGSVNVTSCYEGYEAEGIYINGGTTYIIASDDAINASAADLSNDDDTNGVDDSAPMEASDVDKGEVGEIPDMPDIDVPSGEMNSGNGVVGGLGETVVALV